jgi:hypothetical protein
MANTVDDEAFILNGAIARYLEGGSTMLGRVGAIK